MTPGLQELITRVTSIAEECVPKQGASSESADAAAGSGEVKDPFLRLKFSAHRRRNQCQALIKERQGILNASGLTNKALQLAVGIREALGALEDDVAQLTQLLRKQANGKLKRLGVDEIEARRQDVSVLRTQLAQLRVSFRGNVEIDFPPSPSPFPDPRETQQDAKMAITDHISAPPSAEDVGQMSKWKERDAEFDRQLEGLAGALDRVMSTTNRIGETLVRQEVMAVEVAASAESMEGQLQYLTKRTKDIIRQDSNSTFCLRTVSFILLLITGGYCYTKVVRYLDSAAPPG
eukprot:GHVT01002715.1.p1 GENE.GHVT01002715.1~~GHVT01002715.1.p1  ORF type:complete len:292 (+),score=49.44 GHVT01002715.1:1420-2295(+)